MLQLKQDIANHTYKRCYLLYGDEGYLRKQYKDNLIADVVPDGDTMNFNSFRGNDIDVPAIIDLAETLPFFADRRVILIEDSGLCKSGGEQLAEYLPDCPETTLIILVEAAVDKRSKLFKAVSTVGRACEFVVQQENTLRTWIKSKASKEGKTIDSAAISLLLERTGTDMMTISSEMEKLFSYTLDKNNIDVNDVAAIVTVSTSGKVFDMIAAMAEKKQDKALEMYYDLLSHKETPYGILSLIGRQFNMMLQVKELQNEGFGRGQIAQKMGIAPFIEQKYERQAAGFSMGRIRKALEACVEADENVKIRSFDARMCVELLIIEFSANEKQKK